MSAPREHKALVPPLKMIANSAAGHAAAHAGIALLHDQFVVVYGSLVDEGLLCAEEFVLGNEKPFLSPLNEIRPL